MQTPLIQNTLLIGFSLFSVVGIILYSLKDQRNSSYGVFAIAFFLLGISGLLSKHPSAIGAFLLSLVAARRLKTKFDAK